MEWSGSAEELGFPLALTLRERDGAESRSGTVRSSKESPLFSKFTGSKEDKNEGNTKLVTEFW
jgi:hypothetical protein